MKEQNNALWVERNDRLPTEIDGDAQGCILAYHVHNGVMMTHWALVEHNRFMSHWRHVPPPPENIDPKYKQQ